MSVTSQYFFLKSWFTGPFVVMNATDSHEQPFHLTPSFPTLLTFDRPNAEIMLDLGSKIATGANMSMVSKQLAQAGAIMTSPIRVQGVPWLFVPYAGQRPNAHLLNDMLVRVNFDFYIETPWYCSDAIGTYSIYLFLFLDKQGHLQGQVDGLWFQYDGGGPFCTGAITDGLNAATPAVAAEVKPLLAQALAASSGIKFKNLYYLPGNGTRAPGTFIQDAFADMRLGLLVG